MSLRALVAVVACAWVLLASSAAHAHDFSPGVLALAQDGPDRYQIMWTEPVDSKGAPAGVSLELPAHCQRSKSALHCEGGLAGVVRFVGVNEARMQIVVSVTRTGGQRDDYMVTGDDPSLDFGKRAQSSAALWLRLGAQHILGGLDHLAFVVGLMLLLHLRASRRLFWTITAFTLAHSLTLSLAVLGVWRLPANSVEACIALSVLLVAAEVLHDRQTAMRRWPYLVSGVFGLVHGMGFAGALTRAGLPEDAIVSSLLFFNLGVELGQLVVVAILLLGALLLKRFRPQLSQLRPATCYAMGALSAYWLIGRALRIVG